MRGGKGPTQGCRLTRETTTRAARRAYLDLSVELLIGLIRKRGQKRRHEICGKRGAQIRRRGVDAEQRRGGSELGGGPRPDGRETPPPRKRRGFRLRRCGSLPPPRFVSGQECRAGPRAPEYRELLLSAQKSRRTPVGARCDGRPLPKGSNRLQSITNTPLGLVDREASPSASRDTWPARPRRHRTWLVGRRHGAGKNRRPGSKRERGSWATGLSK